MESVFIILTAAIAGILSYHISNKFKKGPVFGSAIVTLGAGIILPLLLPGLGEKLMVAAACGSYAGMAGTKLVPFIYEIGLISALAGIILILATSAYPGVGGRLGTIAALACFAWMGMRRTFREASKIKPDKIEAPKIRVWE